MVLVDRLGQVRQLAVDAGGVSYLEDHTPIGSWSQTSLVRIPTTGGARVVLDPAVSLGGPLYASLGSITYSELSPDTRRAELRLVPADGSRPPVVEFVDFSRDGARAPASPPLAAVDVAWHKELMRSLALVVTVVVAALATPSLAQVRPAPLRPPVAPPVVTTARSAPTPVPVAAGTILPGEFAIRHVMSKKYVSLAHGVISTSLTLGLTEKLRIVQASRGQDAIQGVDGTILTSNQTGVTFEGIWYPGEVFANLPTSSPARGTAWAFAGGENGEYVITTPFNQVPHAITLAGQDWSRFLMEGRPSMAPTHFHVAKCGEVGSGHRYLVGPVGLTTEVFAGRGSYPPRLMRHPDGTYEFEFIGNTPPTHYLTVTGGGGFANDQDAPEGRVLAFDRTASHEWEKFRIVDQGDCTYAIQTPKGFFLGWSVDRLHPNVTSRVSDVKAARAAGYTATVEFFPVDL